MLRLIDYKSTVNRGKIVKPNLLLSMSKQRANLQKLQTYYRQNYSPVLATNPLLRLLYRFDWDATKSGTYYYQKAKEDVNELASSVGITTSINAGDINYGSFYGHLPVALIYSNESTATDTFRSNWADMVPVKVLVSPTTKGGLARPDLVRASDGYGVIAIDIPLLAFMYKKWGDANNAKPESERERPEYFLGRYVLPNMLPSQFDAIITNMLYMDEEYIDLEDSAFTTPFAMVDHTRAILNEITVLKAEFSKSDYTPTKVLDNVIAMTAENMLDVAPIIYDGDTEANYWVRLAAALPYVMAGTVLAVKDPSPSSTYNVAKVVGRRIKGQRTIAKIEDKKFSVEVDGLYEQLLTLLSDRAKNKK